MLDYWQYMIHFVHKDQYIQPRQCVEQVCQDNLLIYLFFLDAPVTIEKDFDKLDNIFRGFLKPTKKKSMTKKNELF